MTTTEKKYPDGAQPVDMERALQFFREFANQERKSVGLMYVATLRADLPVKYAVLNVLTTELALTPNEVQRLLEVQLKYKRSKSSIRAGLRRLTVFGLATVEKRRSRKAKTAYQLTKRGYQFVLSKDMKR